MNVIKSVFLFIATLSSVHVVNHVEANGEEGVCLGDQKSMDDDSPKDKVVYIIRHGEKVYTQFNATAYHYACESQQGWARAYHLISVFGGGGGSNSNNFRTPNALFSYNYDDSINCRTSRGFYRTQATIAPLADYLGIDINNATGSYPTVCGYSFDNPDDNCHPTVVGGSTNGFGMCCNTAAAAVIKSTLFNSLQCGNEVNAVLASWEHANIFYLAEALGANTTGLVWAGTQFDTVLALHFDATTHEFIRMDHSLTQGFKWIGPTENSTVAVSFGPGEYPGID